MRTKLVVKETEGQRVRVSIVALGYDINEGDMTPKDAEIGHVNLSLSNPKLSINVVREDEAWVGPVQVQVP